jgi:tetratricopeptide (TPR) repeat protein
LIDQFNNSSSSEVRISSLAGLIKLGETTEAQKLADGLGLQGWIDLLSPTNLPKPSNVGSDLVLIGDKSYQTVPNTSEGNALLKAAAAALDQAEQPEGVRLSNEINDWLQGRELAASGKADAALDWFNRTYAASEQRQHANAGVLLDRAGVYAELKQPDRALTDFVVALQLNGNLSSAIVEAITRRPELLAFWASNQKGYQQLINILPTLTATPTSTPTPTPTVTPAQTATLMPTATVAPTAAPVAQPQFTSPTPGFQPQILTPIPTVTPRPATQLRPIVVSSPTDLLAVAPRAAWTNGSGQSSLWLDQYPAADSTLAPRGYAAYVPADRTLETGAVVGQRLVLATHPEFKPDGYIQGVFPLTLPTQGATVAATLEFISSARFGSGVDGVQVEMWWFDSAGGSSPGKLLAQVGASDNGSATNLPGDLSLNGGQTGELRIIVRARANSGNDWLTWTQLTVSPN